MLLKDTAFVFPGQGSQYAGMGVEICEYSENAKEIFHTMDTTLETPLSRICFHGPEEELKLTTNTQPALLTVSAAIWEILKEHNIEPEACAGHSLGEYSALVSSGVIPFVDAVSIVRNRGKYMQEAVPVGVGSMAAVMGLDTDSIEKVINKHRTDNQVISIANLNCPGQCVIAGHTTAVEASMPDLKEAGARRAIPLPVSAPFHSSLMEPAKEKLSPEIDQISFRQPMFGFYSNVTATRLDDPEEIKEKLKEQITHPVLWETLITNMLNDGITQFVEVGAGRVLSGLIKKIDRSATVLNIEDKASLEKFLEWAENKQGE